MSKIKLTRMEKSPPHYHPSICSDCIDFEECRKKKPESSNIRPSYSEYPCFEERGEE